MMVNFAQSHYNRIVENMAHKDVVVAENMGDKVDMVHKVAVAVENIAHNVWWVLKT